MVELKDLKIMPVYSSDEEVKKFYNQTLCLAKTYSRVSAYFNGGIFKYISNGLSKLLENEGVMKLVLSSEIDEKTYENIKKGYELRDTKYIKKCINEKFFDLKNIEYDISILSYLIAINKLEIRVAFKPVGIMHDKFGFIEDSHGNKLLFAGSNNETEAAIEYNHESFETTINWGECSLHELKKIEYREKQFERIWNNLEKNLIVLPMTDVINESLISKITNDFYTTNLNFIKINNFIRVNVDENDVRIQTSFDINDLICDYEFKDFKPFSKVLDNNVILISEIAESIKDIYYLKEKLENISKVYQYKLIFSDEFKEYIDKYYYDFESLSEVGRGIKNKDYMKTDSSFLSFCDDLNKTLNRPLRDPQLYAAYHAVKLRKTMNFSVPGSGKTATILGAFEYLNSLDVDDTNYVDTLIVFGPINCFKAWKDEYKIVSKKYSFKTEDVDIINIKNYEDLNTKKLFLQYGINKARLILINFDVITQLSDILEKYVSKKTFIVFDEIHRIKNRESAKYVSCMKIVNDSKFRVALTGTPLPNGYVDLINIFNLLYGEYSQKYFGMYEDEMKKADKNYDKYGVEYTELNEKMYPFYIRMTKEELKVPKAEKDNLVYVDASETEADLYFNILDNCSNHLESAIKLVEVGCIPEKATEKLDENEINCFSFGDMDFCNISRASYAMTSKIEALIKQMKLNKGKSVIWCTFIDSINSINYYLKQKGYKTAVIYGSTPNDERSSLIDSFNNTNNIDVIITNPQTLAESISLHKACHNAYYMELNYNLSQYLQSKDRIHRLGLSSEEKTYYHIFINRYDGTTDTSIDYKIYSRLLKKEKKMINAIEQGSFLFKEYNNPNESDDIISDIKANRGNN